MRLRNGMPIRMLVRRFWMRPPSTRVWLFSSTTEVSASRLVNRGELMGGGSLAPTSLTSGLTSGATVPGSPMRGVTVRMMPASLYSTVWVIELPVIPPVATGTCCDVTIGTEVDTLMTALRFSVVMMVGFDSTLTRFSVDSALSAASTLSAAKANTFRPSGTARPPKGMIDWGGLAGSRPEGDEVMTKFPERIAHSTPSFMSSSSRTSAASTSIRTWRGILSSRLMVSSISFQRRGYVVTMTAFVTSSATKRMSTDRGGRAAPPGGARAPARHPREAAGPGPRDGAHHRCCAQDGPRRRQRRRQGQGGRSVEAGDARGGAALRRGAGDRGAPVAAAVDGVERGRQVARLGVLREVD